MERPSQTPERGVLKETLIVQWSYSPKFPRQKRARSDVFSTKHSSSCLLLESESDLSENMLKCNLWFYTSTIVNHTLEVNLSLLDNKNRQCYVVEKRLSNSESEVKKICVTVDFSIISNLSQKFFHDGALKIQCCVDTSEKVFDEGLEPSKDDFKILVDFQQKHLMNIEKAGVLTKKNVLTWTIPKRSIKNEVEFSSDPFTCVSSVFYLSALNSKRSRKALSISLKCSSRKPKGLQQISTVTLAVLDKFGNMHYETHYAKDEIFQDSSTVFLNCDKVLEDRAEFFDKGKLTIYCALQIENSPEVYFNALRPGGSSEPSKISTVSSLIENAEDVKFTPSEPSRVRELIPSPANSKSVENSDQQLVTKNYKFAHSNAEDRSKFEEALNEMLRLIHDRRVDAPFASTIISLLFSTAKENYKGTITKVLLNLLIENNYWDETDLLMISRNMNHISMTEQWLSFIKSKPDLVNVIVQSLAHEK